VDRFLCVKRIPTTGRRTQNNPGHAVSQGQQEGKTANENKFWIGLQI
jgi:hypothetical protein